MPVYQYTCPACAEQFDARLPVEQRDQAGCPSCGGAAARQFTPRAVMVQSRIEPKLTRYRELHGFEATPQHSAEYNYRRKDEQNQRDLAETLAAQKPRKSVKEIMLEKYPDTRFDQPLRPVDVAEISAGLAAGPPPGGPHA